VAPDERADLRKIPGGVLASRGFRAAGVSAGIKIAEGQLDIGLLVADAPCAAAGVFTTNLIQAAPVRYSRQVVERGSARAVVVNSGNANACTSSRGDHDAAVMAVAVEQTGQAPATEVLVASTGIIGQRLPIENVKSGIAMAAAALGNTPEHDEKFARAIMTTDTKCKRAAVSFQLGGATCRLGGACKGSGMIAPNMATMLAFITTDAAIRPKALQPALRRAVERSFNRITIDSHTSTNDTVFILASGGAGNRELAADDDETVVFQQALDAVCCSLAGQIVADGEGATRVVEVEVKGAASTVDALAAARAIANSPLVKTAINGGDPNWGRVVSAAGYSGARLEPGRVELLINGLPACYNGGPAKTPQAKLAEQMARGHVKFTLDLGVGDKSETVWTCDLSREYVAINADYHT